MRLSFFAIPIVVVAVSAHAADPKPQASPDHAAPTQLAPPSVCPRTNSYQAARLNKPLTPHRLAELPAANEYKAVYRRIDGCEVPMVVSYGIGASDDRKPATR